VQRKLCEFPDEHLKPPPLLTGDDLIAEGYAPGPRFAEILTAVEDAQLEGQLRTSGDAMQLVREKFPLH
jgi:poly(A) polymerase